MSSMRRFYGKKPQDTQPEQYEITPHAKLSPDTRVQQLRETDQNFDFSQGSNNESGSFRGLKLNTPPNMMHPSGDFAHGGRVGAGISPSPVGTSDSPLAASHYAKTSIQEVRDAFDNLNGTPKSPDAPAKGHLPRDTPRLTVPTLPLNQPADQTAKAQRREQSTNRLFDKLVQEAVKAAPTLSRRQFISVLAAHGLMSDDERLMQVMSYIQASDADLTESDVDFIRTKSNLVERALNGRLIIPDFVKFTKIIQSIYEETLPNRDGANADYIPQLAKVNPEQYGVAVCTIDGQRFSIGDDDVPFCVQSCSKVITYAIAQSLHGPAKVHQHVGVEPSGRAFNELSLDERGHNEDIKKRKNLIKAGLIEEASKLKIRPAIPHNPYINAGAIMCASLVKPKDSEDVRFDYVMKVWQEMCGYHPKSRTLRSPTFANSTYLSERASADRNFCLGYMMREEGAFEEGIDIVKALESYFMYCSIECTVHTLSVVAGTLANGGTCPVTGRKVFEPHIVRNCLSVMHSCGMYDFSGQFAFKMGFPCKSGVGGALVIVIPGICGFCTWSPRLDEIGNSVRGVHFCDLLAKKFAFHSFAPTMTATSEATDEERAAAAAEAQLSSVKKASETSSHLDSGGVEDATDTKAKNRLLAKANWSILREAASHTGKIKRMSDPKAQKPAEEVAGGSPTSSVSTPRQHYRRNSGSFLSPNIVSVPKVSEGPWDPRRTTSGLGVQRTKEEDILDMLWSSFDGDLNFLKQLVARGVDVNMADYDGRTALHLAACEGHTDLCRYLLNAGACPNPEDRFRGTPASDAKVYSAPQLAPQNGAVRQSTQDIADRSELFNLLNSATKLHPNTPSPLYISIETKAETSGASEEAMAIYIALAAGSAALDGTVTRDDLINMLNSSGIDAQNDRRLRNCLSAIPPPPRSIGPMDLEVCIAVPVILAALQGNLVIPCWSSFVQICEDAFETASGDKSGTVASYIPALSKVDPSKFGVSVCSIDGQRWSRGDVKDEFGVQSCMKPINYAIALETKGFDKVFKHIGIEPSGMAFNEMALDRRRVEDETGTAVPHNPLINAGAIMCCSLIQEGRSVSKKLETVLSYWRRLTGGESPCNIDEEMYRSESMSANRNRCLAYMMNEAGAFPEGAVLERELEFYFMCCSQLQNANTMAVVAGTLANGGVSPVTNDRIFSPKTVQAVLSVMFTCGMYDFSGQFSFTMGFPSKSGVAGACLIVVPNVMGICSWSPRLDGNGNSTRGIRFAESLADVLQLHNFDKVASVSANRGGKTKIDPRSQPDAEIREVSAQLIMAASMGDMIACTSIVERHGAHLINMGDYDMRTPLHLAASENQEKVVEYFLNQSGVSLNQKDRWGARPIDDAIKNGSSEVVHLLKSAMQAKSN